MANTTKRNVTIPTLNWIPALGMFGPIVYPRFIYETTAFSMVMSGYEVYEHAVSGKYAGAKVKLTVNNFNDPDRFAEDTSVTPKPIDITKNFGAAVNGQAVAVDPTTKTDAVKLGDDNTSEEAESSIPKVATPIPGNMSKSQRKKAAKEAARAAAAAKAAEAASTEDDVDTDTEDVAETTEETVTE